MDNDPPESPPASDPATVTPIPVAFKRPPGDDAPILHVVGRFDSRDGCNHMHYHGQTADGRYTIRQVQYRFREGETDVECGQCSTRLDPMWVLQQLAARESEYNRRRAVAQDEMERLSGRSRTRCEKCGHMTRISRTRPRETGR